MLKKTFTASAKYSLKAANEQDLAIAQYAEFNVQTQSYRNIKPGSEMKKFIVSNGRYVRFDLYELNQNF